ncbi:TPA: histidinol dehydrogenase [Candidatus Gracilibacteria bacterium]|nr:histidinol dehydrogenase [Candidatus Gracilibacteria bacterium]
MKFIKNISENFNNPNFQNFTNQFTLHDLCKRSGIDYDKVFEIVSEIESNIITNGDAELKALTEKFDGVTLDNFLVTSEEITFAVQIIEKEKPELIQAIKQAHANITKFHNAQKRNSTEKIETTKGVECWQEFRAIEKVGLYIPGGTAPLFSTLLMLAIPAQIAGCKKRVLCTPPQKDGKIHPAILATAHIAGVSEIYKVGGSQAIFAMAHGTETIPKVDKIFGPGNSFVTAAKMKISGHTAIDMPAGPSEVLVLSDETGNVEFIASDLLSQAEHGTDSQAVLITTCEKVAQKTLEEIEKQLSKLNRNEVALEALKSSFIVVCETVEEAIEISNEYAPEHLILHVKNWKNLLSNITNAGSVFCGEFTPESAGDYASGTNHTLPTSGFARSFSGVSVESFGKWITFQHITQQGIENLGDTIEIMAEEEGLDAHKNAVVVRRR